MSLLASRAGYVLAIVYLGIAAFVVHAEVRAPGGNWIKLSGMGTFLITLPSQGTLGVILVRVGIPKVNFDDPGFGGYSQLLGHVLLTAFLVYLLGAGLEWGVRHIFVTAGPTAR
jgi:hypothetical protein